ncbi:MAG: tRNA (guanosine(46)-N7)-methyltransferase TrmB [Kiritimatiellae bacterium]|nr:tRNA (guanosine(46)-N7)-methyltransferase TrmB [Kiritimatiellia bacterium]
MSDTARAVGSTRIFPDDWLNPLPLSDLFPAAQPLEVDVGCGKGRFLLARAAAHPQVNFLGLDRMLRRIRKVDRKAVRRGLGNLRLLRCEAYYAVTYLLPPAAVSTYYIFFPDPWPKKRHHWHRLFDPPFVEALHRTLLPGGTFHFATDHLPYFEEVRGILAADSRFESAPPFEPGEEERTDFELLFIHLAPIGRCSFRKRA